MTNNIELFTAIICLFGCYNGILLFVKDKKIILAHLALLTVALSYSGNYIVAKEVMNGSSIHPLPLMAFRVIGASILFWLIHSIWIKEKIEKKDIWHLMFCSLLGVIGAHSLYLFGLERTSPINSSLLISTTPIMVTIFSVWILKVQIGVRNIIGLILAAIGALILILGKGEVSMDSKFFVGNLLMLCNAVVFGLYLVMIKPMLNKYQALTVIKWVFTFSIPIVLLMSWSHLWNMDYQSVDGMTWLGIGYIVIFATFITYSCNAFGVKIVGPVIAGFYLYLQPFITSFLSLFFEKEEITMLKIGAGIFILLGLYLNAKQSIKKPH